MLSSAELALLDSQERYSYESLQEGKERDEYERTLRERIVSRAKGSSSKELGQRLGQPPAGGALLDALGWALVCGGLILICFAIWIYDTAPSGTHNIGLLNQQSGMTILGSTLAVCGSVFVAAGWIGRGRA